MAVAALIASLILTLCVSPVFPNGFCDLLADEGCICREYYGEVSVHCNDLDLTAFPVLNFADETLTIDVLDVSGNRIRELSEDAFISGRIRHLTMNYNEGGDMSSAFFSNLTRSVTSYFESITMDNSGFTELPDFSDGFERLRKISFQNNHILSLNFMLLRYIPNLEEVYLSGNPIQTEFDVTSWSYLSLRVFDISWDAGFGPVLFEQLSRAAGFFLETLSAQGSSFGSASAEYIGEFVSLQFLEIKGCHLDDDSLKFIDRGWYIYPPIRELSFPDNVLTEIPRKFVSDLGDLHVIDLSNNAIEQVTNGSFRHNPHLAYIDLSHNNIRVVEPMAFTRDGVIEQLREIDLSHNYLLTLHNDVMNGLAVGETNLLIAHNPWTCDCDLEALALYAFLESAGRPGPLDPYEIFHELRCSTPARLSGTLLKDLLGETDVMCSDTTRELL